MIPDISKWNTSNISDMSYLFDKCKTLKELTDISKWNFRKDIDISNIFKDCIKLDNLKKFQFIKQNANNKKD